MRAFLDCIPCFIRQALDAARFATDDEAIHERVLREALRAASEIDLRTTPPAMGQGLHRLIRELTGNDDPYRAVKRRFNRAALALYPSLSQRVEHSGEPFETAVRLAIAGNIIDFGIHSRLDEAGVGAAVHHALAAPLRGQPDALRRAVEQAREVLYLADNAGEIVFDRLLIERMPQEKVAVAVKGGPVLNDATMEDAAAAGLTELVEVIDNGSDAPGTILDDCSEAFRRRFRRADVVVAKGQGNYETLSDADQDIFFVLKAKCPVIARDLGCEMGSLVAERRPGVGSPPPRSG
ncbi:MAG: damage-control phosphatase ARMT1 family protein [bacterium]